MGPLGGGGGAAMARGSAPPAAAPGAAAAARGSGNRGFVVTKPGQCRQLAAPFPRCCELPLLGFERLQQHSLFFGTFALLEEENRSHRTYYRYRRFKILLAVTQSS